MDCRILIWQVDYCFPAYTLEKKSTDNFGPEELQEQGRGFVFTTDAENKLEGAFGMLVPHVTAALKSRDGTLKLQALIFLRVSAWFVNPSTINNHMGELIGVVTPCVDEEWYKIIAEALRVLSVFAQCLRPMREDRSRFDDSIPSGDCGRFGPILFDSIFPRFSKSDIDQEIKECSILALGSVIAHVGDACAEQLKANEPKTSVFLTGD